MPCGPQMVGRAPDSRGGAAAPGFAHRAPCVGPGHVEPNEQDRRRLRTLLVWLGWAVFAVVTAASILALI